MREPSGQTKRGVYVRVLYVHQTEERDRAAAEEPSEEEAAAAAAGQGRREEYERRLAAWKGRLRSLWRMNDGH